MPQKSTTRERLVAAATSPLLLLILASLVVWLPFYLAYLFLVRLLVEIFWGLRGRRVLLVYSRSPVWREYVETKWLPELGDHAVVLDWSDRATWTLTRPLAAWVFGAWQPSRDFNPMVILIPRFARIRRIGFYYAFRDSKHGDDTALERAECELFSFVRELQRRAD